MLSLFDSPILVKTAAFRLRLYEEKDCLAVTSYLQEPEVNDPLITTPSPFLYQDAIKFLRKMQKSYQAGRPEFFIIADPQTDEAIGGIGLYLEHSLAMRPQVGELGYWLGQPYWMQGIMGAAIPFVLDYGFETLGYRCITAVTSTDNVASQKLLEHLGFTYLGEEWPLEKPQRGSEKVTSWEIAAQDWATRRAKDRTLLPKRKRKKLI